MKSTQQPGGCPAPPQNHTTHRVQKPPDSAVQAVQRAFAGDVAAPAPKAFDAADDLVGTHTFFIHYLMISPEGVGAVCVYFYDPVQHVLAAVSGVKRQVILAQAFRWPLNTDLILAVSKCRKHAGARGGENDFAAGGKFFGDEGVEVPQVNNFFHKICDSQPQALSNNHCIDWIFLFQHIILPDTLYRTYNPYSLDILRSLLSL